MSQNTELDTIKRKIRALSEKTVSNGCSEAEAMVAMKKVGELLEQYNLSMDEVTLRQETCTTLRFETGNKHAGAAVDASSLIARFCGCKVWMSRTPSGVVLSFFGLESDAQMAVYLCDVIQKSHKTEYHTFKLTEAYANFTAHRRILSANFLRGFVLGVVNQLNTLLKERLTREREAAAASVKVTASDAATVAAAKATTGTALISVAKSEFVEQEYSKLGMKLRTVQRVQKGIYNHDARAAGNTAGRKVNLSRPLARGSEKASGYLN